MGTRTAVVTVRGSLDVRLKNDLDTDETAQARATLGDAPALTFTSGTTAGKANRVFCRKGMTVVESGSPVDIDVFDYASQNMGAGAGLDGLGQSLGMVDIVVFYIRNYSTSGGNLLVGGEGTTAAWNSLFSSQTSAPDDAVLVIKPKGFTLIAAPGDPAYAVADTSNHLLRIDASAGTCTFDIVIIGRSA